MKKALLLLLLLFTAMAYAETTLIQAETITSPLTVDIKIEHAIEKEELQWGLMGRKTLKENSGMLFHYEEPSRPLIWAFNVFVDLSIAFIDENHVIRELYDLPSNPEVMDPKRPVNEFDDMDKYDSHDPAISFFRRHGVVPLFAAKYALEMPMGWFEDNDVTIGDTITWNRFRKRCYIAHTLNVDSIIPEDDNIIMIEFPGKKQHSVSAPEIDDLLDIVVLDRSKFVRQLGTLKGGREESIKPVFVTEEPAKYIVLGKQGLIKENRIRKWALWQDIDNSSD